MLFLFNQGVDLEAHGESISDTLWVTEFGRLLWKNIIYFVSVFFKRLLRHWDIYTNYAYSFSASKLSLFGFNWKCKQGNICSVGFLIIITHLDVFFLHNHLKLTPKFKLRTTASDSNINRYSLTFNYLEITTGKILYLFFHQYYWL